MIIPITIENGVLKLPLGTQLPPEIKHATLVVGEGLHSNDDLSSIELQLAVLRNPAFDFLREEEDLYSDADILPENRNPRFHEHLKND
jgi:hypothetical protein